MTAPLTIIVEIPEGKNCQFMSNTHNILNNCLLLDVSNTKIYCKVFNEQLVSYTEDGYIYVLKCKSCSKLAKGG